MHQLHEFVKSKICKHISPRLFCSELLKKADLLGKKVTADRRARNWKILKQLSEPVWSLLAQIMGLVVLRSALMSVFHQPAAWCSPIEAAVAGKCPQALSHCLTCFLSLLCCTPLHDLCPMLSHTQWEEQQVTRWQRCVGVGDLIVSAEQRDSSARDSGGGDSSVRNS